MKWATNIFVKIEEPFKVHNVYNLPSWLYPFNGIHPPAIQALISYIANSKVSIETRTNRDIEQLLCSTSYRCKRLFIKSLDYLDRIRPGTIFVVFKFLKSSFLRILRSL
jgi:hypothetical protein